MRLRGRDFGDTFDRRRSDGHEYFYPTSSVPDWYQEEIRGEARRYEINWHDGKYQGELIVDDEEHTVYVHVDRY